MGSDRYLAIALLAGLMVVANFAMFDLAERNGTFSLASILGFKDRILPNSKVPLHIPATGIAVVDNYVAFIVSVFWIDLDPKNHLAHLQGFHFLGTLNASWLLMLIETHRGQRGAGFYFATYFIEVVAELAGLGFFTPLWCIVHLIATPIPSAKTPNDAEKTLLPASGNLGPLGYALMVGLVAPSFLMALGKNDQPGFFSQQVWTLIRLFHPVLLYAAWKLIVSFQGPVVKNKSAGSRAASVRKLYTFTILAAALHHALFMGVLFSDYWAADWVKPEVTKAFWASSPFVPFPFWKRDQIKSLSFTEGMTTFFHWDQLLAASSMVVWTSFLYIEAAKRRSSFGEILNTFLQATFLVVIGGPLAGAAYMLQERDNVVLLPIESGNKKNN